MARLTDREYVAKHYQLRRLWLSHPGMFGNLSMHQQWVLHDFFRPPKSLTECQLLAHRRIISKEQPSLPQQAGHALKALTDLLGRTATQGTAQVALGHDKKLRVRTLVRPEPDIEALVRVYWQLAGQLVKDDMPNDIAGDTHKAV